MQWWTFLRQEALCLTVTALVVGGHVLRCNGVLQELPQVCYCYWDWTQTTTLPYSHCPPIPSMGSGHYGPAEDRAGKSVCNCVSGSVYQVAHGLPSSRPAGNLHCSPADGADCLSLRGSRGPVVRSRCELLMTDVCETLGVKKLNTMA